MVGTDSSDCSSQELMSVGRQGPVEKTVTVATTKSRSAWKRGNKHAKKKKKATTAKKHQDIGSMSENNVNNSGRDDNDKLSVNLLMSEEEDGVG
jgi:hypothetical protein